MASVVIGDGDARRTRPARCWRPAPPSAALIGRKPSAISMTRGDRHRRAEPGQRLEQRAEAERDDDRLDPLVVADRGERPAQHVEVPGHHGHVVDPDRVDHDPHDREEAERGTLGAPQDRLADRHRSRPRPRRRPRRRSETQRGRPRPASAARRAGRTASTSGSAAKSERQPSESPTGSRTWRYIGVHLRAGSRCYGRCRRRVSDGSSDIPRSSALSTDRPRSEASSTSTVWASADLRRPAGRRRRRPACRQPGLAVTRSSAPVASTVAALRSPSSPRGPGLSRL